jgi:hypothetical protein
MKNPQDKDKISKFFFPLRSNVGYFDSPDGYLSLLNQIKEASLLFDHLIFESGVYTAIVWDGGSQDFWIPRDQVSEEQLLEMQTKHKPIGGEAQLAISTRGKQPVTILSGEVKRNFHCEFHTVLRSLNAESLPWIELESFELTKQGKETSNQIKKAFERDYSESIPTDNYFLKSKIISNLSRDIVLSESIQASASINSIYAPILLQKAKMPTAPGISALKIIVPNFTHLHWEQIIELRKLECLQKFREKLLLYEITAKKARFADQDDNEYEKQVLLAHNKELIRELSACRPKLNDMVGNIALDIISYLFPLPYVSAIANGIRHLRKLNEYKKSWIAAFSKIKD